MFTLISMKKALTVCLVFLLIPTASYAKLNPKIASEMMKRFNNKVSSCPGDKPSFMCSGIIIRGINRANKLPHAWSLKAVNIQKQSFSFAFLRKDIQFSSFPRDYNSGFIIYPHDQTPKSKNKYKIFCAFPVDGGTDTRQGNGCGLPINNLSVTNQPCDNIGVTTLNAWINHFNGIISSGNPNFITRQCSFDMVKAGRVGLFDVVVKANQYIQKNAPKYYMRNNELLMHSWNVNNPSDLPIEAFFYIINSNLGLTTARGYQKDYFTQTNGKAVPIVRIELSKVANGDIKITYSEDDQIPETKDNGGGGDIPIPAGIRTPLIQFLPKSYKFKSGEEYNLTLTLPSNVWMYTCPGSSVFSSVNSKCTLGNSIYTYNSSTGANGVIKGVFVPRFNGIAPSISYGPNYLLSASGVNSIKVKVTKKN